MKVIGKYTLIGYKPDSADYCRGCHMASYSSAFLFYNELSQEDLIAKLSEAVADEFDLGYNETPMQYMILKNGIKIFDEMEACGYVSCDNEADEIEAKFVVEQSKAKADAMKDKKKEIKELQESIRLQKRREKELQEAEAHLNYLKSKLHS